MSSNEKFKIAIYDLEGNLITTVFGIKEAYDLTGANRNNISSALTGRNVTAGGYQFRKYDIEPNRSIGNALDVDAGPNERPVAKYFEDKLISVYKSTRDAGLKTGIAPGNIWTSAEKGYKATIFNFKFI